MNKSIIKNILGFMAVFAIIGVQIPDVQALSLSGCIDKRIYQKVVRNHENAIKHCYEVALLKDKTLEGRMVTQFLILPDGSVQTVEILETTMSNPEMAQCILDEIKTWQFPSMVGGCESSISVEYPFVFSSNYVPPTNLAHVRVLFAEDDEIVVESADESTSLPEAVEKKD